jgi:hypothetical protein
VVSMNLIWTNETMHIRIVNDCSSRSHGHSGSITYSCVSMRAVCQPVLQPQQRQLYLLKYSCEPDCLVTWHGRDEVLPTLAIQSYHWCTMYISTQIMSLLCGGGGPYYYPQNSFALPWLECIVTIVNQGHFDCLLEKFKSLCTKVRNEMI